MVDSTFPLKKAADVWVGELKSMMKTPCWQRHLCNASDPEGNRIAELELIL